MTDQPQIDLSKVLATVRRRLWLIVAIAVAAAAIAFGISALQPDRYEATADLLFRQADPTPRVNPDEPLPDVADAPDRVAATNLALASLDTVVLRVKGSLGSSLSVDELRDRVDVEPAGQADIVTVKASGSSGAEAARYANAFADAVVALRRERAQDRVQQVIDAIEGQLQGATPGSEAAQRLQTRAEELRVQKNLQSGDVEVVERAIPPRDRSSPKPVRNAVVGGVVGVLLGVLVAILLARFDRRLSSDEEIAKVVGAPVIARVPERKHSDWEHQLFVEAFQFLRANLQLRSSGANMRVIAVTSAVPESGKSTVAERLSEAFALSGSEVVVVDGDLRRPTLHQYFGTELDPGVTTAIVGEQDPSGLLRATRYPGVRLLAAGAPLALPASVIASSDGIAALLARLRDVAEYVVVDTSPVTIGAEASAIAAAADGAIVTVDMRKAKRDVLAAAVDQLRGAGVNIVGVVLNRAEVILADESYRGYYGTGLLREPAAPRRAAVPGNGDSGAPRRAGRAWRASRDA